MVYTRKRTYKRKRPMMRRRKRTMNISRPMSNVARIKRTFYYGNWTPSTASTSGFWQYFQFRLNQLPSYTEITALFDRYKINGIKVTFRPRYDNFAGNDTTDTTLPGTTAQGLTSLHIIRDPDSQLVPSGTYTLGTFNTFLENGNVRSYQGTRPVSIYFKPKVDRYIGASATASRMAAPWFIATNTDHYGFHAFLQDVNFTGTFNQSFDIHVTYYMLAQGLK